MFKDKAEIWARLSSIWRGEEKLSVVFWYYFILGSLAISLFVSIPFGIMILLGVTNILFASVIIYTPLLIYYFWILGSLWNSAFNVQWVAWGYMTRAFVVFNIIYSVSGFLE